MIDIATRDLAINQVDTSMIDVLREWIVREKVNLEGFIANPTVHIDYNPYLFFDIIALQQRVVNLGKIEQDLLVIAKYKTNADAGVTKAMHDNALVQIPVIIWKRLYEWTAKRVKEMEEYLANANNSNIPLPVEDYQGLVTFNTAKFMSDLTIYRSASSNLGIIMEYLTQ